MDILNNYIAHLPSIFYSSMAVASRMRGNVSFGNCDFASIILASMPHVWQNQHNLMHSMVPEVTSRAFPDLEAIKRVMNQSTLRSRRPRARLM
jgi:hypothetical protein